MARGEHHRIHAHDRVQRKRRRIAQEAARLISEQGIRDYRHAKVKAAGRLGVGDEQSLPRNREIEQALREHQRLFQSEEQPAALQVRREAACEAMRFLAAFQPHLVGAVLSGTADVHSAVCLQLYSETAEAVTDFLRDNEIPFQQASRRLHMYQNEYREFPVLQLMADGLPFDLTIMPLSARRQPPLDRVDDRPMARASLRAVETLLSEDEIALFENSV